MVSGLFGNHAEKFIPVFYHKNGDAWQPWCVARADFFGSSSTPNLWLDGSVDAGADYDNWQDDLLAQAAVPTDVTIDVDVVLAGFDFDVDVTICIEADGIGKDMRIYVVQVLDHYPAPETYYRNAFRQVITEDVTIGGGACVVVQKLRSLKATDVAQLQDVGIVAWAQEPVSSGPAEIFQAAYVFPFIMTDGFESGDVMAWD